MTNHGHKPDFGQRTPHKSPLHASNEVFILSILDQIGHIKAEGSSVYFRMLTIVDMQMYFKSAYEWRLACQKRVSRVWTSNYIPQYLWDVITCLCPWYLLLSHNSSNIPTIFNKHIWQPDFYHDTKMQYFCHLCRHQLLFVGSLD